MAWPCPPIDSIMRLMTVWRITGKIIIATIITSAKEVMFLPDFVCLSVCLSVSKITQKVTGQIFLKI